MLACCLKKSKLPLHAINRSFPSQQPLPGHSSECPQLLYQLTTCIALPLLSVSSSPLCWPCSSSELPTRQSNPLAQQKQKHFWLDKANCLGSKRTPQTSNWPKASSSKVREQWGQGLLLHQKQAVCWTSTIHLQQRLYTMLQCWKSKQHCNDS